MDLCFLKNAAALRGLPQGELDATHFVCFDWTTRQQLRERGLSVSLSSDEITPMLGKRLDEFAFALSCDWHRHCGEDFTKLEGVSLGAIYEHMLWFQTLLPAYRYLAAVARLIERQSPARIWLQDELDHRVVDAVESTANLRHIPVERIAAANAVGEDGVVPWRPVSLRPVDHVLRAYNFAADLIRFSRLGRRIRLLASYYPTLQRLFETVAEDPRFGLYFLERPPASILSRWLRRGSRFLFPHSQSDHGTTRRVVEIQAQWKQVRHDPDYRRKFVCDDLDGWQSVAGDLDQFFGEILVDLAHQVAGCRAAIRAHEIDLILVPFDAPPVQRMLIEVGRALDIPSMVVLHGLPGAYNARYNCCADYFASWGPATIEIYKTLGCSTTNMRVTGSPKLDTYLPIPKRPRIPVRSILILTNPQDYSSTLPAEDDPEHYIFTVLAACRDLRECEFVVRPHPAESPIRYRDWLAPLALPNLSIQARTPIETLLAQADLVITPVSTVALEAMALGIPILWFDVARSSPPPPFAAGWLQPVRTAQELAACLKTIVREDKLPPTNTARILESFAGPIDGGASRRILDWIARIAGDV
ncbi:MAG: hypothetical protein HY782_22540 [Chloroflexi bacterium]|nr:hypothetical protein [Chloroflexota bacterium]